MEQQDKVTPTDIEHSIDEVWDGDQLEQHYNFLDYHFEELGAYLRARVYLDEPRTALLFGPFESRQSIETVAAPIFLKAVEAYLGRRFLHVTHR